MKSKKISSQKKSGPRGTVSKESVPDEVTVREPVIDRLAFTVRWGVGRKWLRTVNEDKAFKKVEKRLKKATEIGEVKAQWKDASSRYRISTRIQLPGGSKAFVQFGAKDPETLKGGLRVEINPAKMREGDMEHLNDIVRGVIGDQYDALLVGARVTRLDMAVDVEGVRIEDLLIDYRGAHEVSMFVKRMKKNKIETMNFGSVSSNYFNTVYGKREEVVHRAIALLVEERLNADQFKHNLIRRAKEANGMPPTMRVEIRARKMGSHVHELRERGKNRFERFRFAEVAGLAALDDFTRTCFLALVRDVGLRAAAKHYEGQDEHKAIRRATERAPAWWQPEGVWAEGVKVLKRSGIFPADAFKKPRDRDGD